MRPARTRPETSVACFDTRPVWPFPRRSAHDQSDRRRYMADLIPAMWDPERPGQMPAIFRSPWDRGLAALTHEDR